MFPVQVEFHVGELLVSYASRLARANGLIGIADLFNDLQISAQAFHVGESSAINRFALVTGIDPERARSQSFRAVTNHSFEIAGQKFGDNHLMRRQFRVCPACLRKDIGPALSRDTVPRAYARIAWSLTTVHCCPVHRLLLVLPPEPGTNSDFCHAWEPWLMELFDGDLDRPSGAAGKYEAFAAAVLAGEQPLRSGYLADLALDAAGAAAEAFGMSALRGAKWSKTEMSAEDLALATDVGFDLFSKGYQGVQSLLDDLRFESGKPQERPPGRYGKLHEWLLRGGGSDQAFAPLQDHLARHIKDTWPLGSMDICFRTKVMARRFHSVLTAAAQYGLRPRQVHDLLQGAGLKGALALPVYEQIYDASAVDQVLARVSSSVSMQAAMKLLGLTRTQMTTLIEAGFLTVSKGGDKSRPRFSQSDVDTFLARHRDVPVHRNFSMADDGVGILIAARRHGVSTAEIYRMFVEGKLSRICRATEDLLWSSLRVSALEVRRLLSASTKADERIRLSTAAAYLGLSNDFLRRLGEDGWFDLRHGVHPRTRQRMTTVASDALKDFESRFITRRGLARRMRLDVRHVQQRLDVASITPVVASEDGREMVFHLQDCRNFIRNA